MLRWAISNCWKVQINLSFNMPTFTKIIASKKSQLPSPFTQYQQRQDQQQQPPLLISSQRASSSYYKSIWVSHEPKLTLSSRSPPLLPPVEVTARCDTSHNIFRPGRFDRDERDETTQFVSRIKPSTATEGGKIIRHVRFIMDMPENAMGLRKNFHGLIWVKILG